jgi:hypothetical protein
MKNKHFIVQAALLGALLTAGTVQAQVKKESRSSTTRTESNTYDHSYVNLEYDSASGIERITMYKNGEVYKIKYVNDKLTEVIIDGKNILEADFPKYEPMLTKLREQIKRDQEQAARDRAQAALDREQAEKDRAQAMKDRERAQADRKQADKDRERADLDRVQAVKDREQSVRDRAQAEEHRKQADKDRTQAELDRQRAVKDRERAAVDRQQAVKDRAQAEIDRKRAEEDRKELAALIDDLVKENLVKSKDDVYVVELSDAALIVNDKKQSAELHQQFKAKYLKTPGTRLTFTHRGDNHRISIERNNN